MTCKEHNKPVPKIYDIVDKFLNDNNITDARVHPLTSEDGKKWVLDNGEVHPLWEGHSTSNICGCDDEWNRATGWGLCLESAPGLTIIDIDNKEKFIEEFSETGFNQILEDGMSYETQKGYHAWFNGNGEKLSTRRPWGEVYSNAPRYICGPGSANKGTPDTFVIEGTLSEGFLNIIRSSQKEDVDYELPEELPDYNQTLDKITDINVFKFLTKKIPEADKSSLLIEVYNELLATGFSYEEVLVLCWKSPNNKFFIRGEPGKEQMWKDIKNSPVEQGEQIQNPVFRLGERIDRGRLIYIGEELVGTTRSLIPKHNWIYDKNLYKDYLEFFYKSKTVKRPPVRLIKPNEIEEYSKSFPEQVIIEPDISLGSPGDVVAAYGATNQSKSIVALHLASQSKLPTMYIVTEHLEHIISHIQRMGITNIWPTEDKPSEDEIEALAEQADLLGIKLIVIDVLASLLKNPNDADEIDEVMDMLKPLTRNRHTLIIHHSGKDPTSGLRGSSRIEQYVSRIYHISDKYDEDTGTSTVTVKSEKSKTFVGGSTSVLIITREGMDDKGRVEVVPTTKSQMEALDKVDWQVFKAFEDEWKRRYGDSALSHKQMKELLNETSGKSVRVCASFVTSWINGLQVNEAGLKKGHPVYQISGIKVKK